MSKIEWTEETWNIITGCTKTSEGCQNCYAEKMTKRLKAMGQDKYKHGFDKVVFHFAELTRKFGKKQPTPKMIFINSMSDTFHPEIEDIAIAHILEVITWHKHHTFQLLTKRSERLKSFKFASKSNLWLGVTVELAKYKNRIDDLRKTDAKVKFLSCEPLLGDLGELDLTGIHWVIVGGESGPNARPMHPDWVRNIQRQCQEQGVPFFFKQWGEWAPCFEKGKYSNFSENDLQQGWDKLYRFIGINGENICYMSKVGKKKAGCLLDGKEYKEYPA